MIRSVPRTCLGTLLLCTLSTTGLAQEGASDQSEGQVVEDPSTARLISGQTALVAGQTNELALAFEIDPGWHIYWSGQNDTGLPTTIDLDLPEGFEVLEILEPAPERHVSSPDLLDHVLEGPLVLLLKVAVPDSASGQTIRIRGTARWLVCREACMLGEADLELTIGVVSDASEAEASAHARIVKKARALLPVKASDHPDLVSTRWASGALLITANAPGQLWFAPSADSAVIEDLLRSGESDSGELSLRPEGGETATISGVLTYHPRGGEAVHLSVTIPRSDGP